MFKELLETGAETLAIESGSPTEEPEIDVSSFDVVNHEHYPDLDNIDGILITGSSVFSNNHAKQCNIEQFANKNVPSRIRFI